MERAYNISLRKFYEKCLPAARFNGYRFVVCMLAYESNIDYLYETLKKQWNDIDAITDKDFLFLFAGKHIENHTGIRFIDHSCRPDRSLTLAYNDYIEILNNKYIRWGSNRDFIDRYDFEDEYNFEDRYDFEDEYDFKDRYNFEDRKKRAVFTEDLPAEQSKQIMDLLRYFKLSRRELPCLIFTNLYTRINTIVHFSTVNLFSLLSDILCELENLFSVIDELKCEINRYSILRNSKQFSDYVKVNSLRKDLVQFSKMFVPKYRNEIETCMNNLVFSDGLLKQILGKRINAYIALSKSLLEVDISEMNYLIERNEPKHSIENLERLYKRSDDILASFNKPTKR